MKAQKTVKIIIEMQIDLETEFTNNDVLEMFDATIYESISEIFSTANNENDLKVEINQLSVISEFE